MTTSNAKVYVQQFGRFLSSMVMPNVGAFLAWGIITTLFIPTGWLPNDSLVKLVGPMVLNLLPLLIGYTGGKMVGGERGGVVGAVATMGVIVSADIPMFMGAMVAGPIGGYVIKKFDEAVHGKIRSGFEMLVNNFSAGIIGMLLAIVAFLAVGPVLMQFSKALGAGVDAMVRGGYLPLTSLLVEPAKVLFLNNAINHGVFTPLGTQAVAEHGKAVFFLIEANPGPGLGLLLAYWFFGRGDAKGSAPAAAIIHFLGGIHEIYFPYVLMKPRLILALIAGGMTGVFTLVAFGAGLRAPASPGSIFAVLMMTPADSLVGVLSSVTAATAVTFGIASLLLKTAKADPAEDLDAAARRIADMKAESKGQSAPVVSGATIADIDPGCVRSIIVACDAGMGSSAMGASLLRRKLDQAGLERIWSANAAINALPADADVVITHKDLTPRACRAKPEALHLSIGNFIDNAFYDRLVAHLKSGAAPAPAATPATGERSAFQLSASALSIGLPSESKEAAIRRVGEKLVALGYVKPGYVDAMLEREKIVSTYLGQGLAIPHGTNEAKEEVLQTGVVLCQYPDGVEFGPAAEDRAHIVVGIAARNNEHMAVMSALARALDDEALIGRLSKTRDAAEILKAINA